MTNEQNDWRALCVELITAIRRHADCMTLDDEVHDVLDRIRAALAQPEPQGPSDEDLIQLAIDTRLYRFQATAGDPIQYEMTEQQVHAFARAVLDRYARPTIEPLPGAEAP